jgi:hypothetical protein
MDSSNVASLADGEVRLWIEQGASLHLKAATPQGDPVELSENEVQQLIDELRRLLKILITP